MANKLTPTSKAKMPKGDKPADTSTGKAGTTTDLSSSVIKLVKGARNPSGKHSDRHRRFAVMTDGMSVGDWYAACRNNETITGRAHSKLVNLAVRKGFITLTEK